MSKKTFSHILLMGRTSISGIATTLVDTYQYLLTQGVDVTVESTTAELMASHPPQQIADTDALPATIDLIIVIGGDGSLLNAAHIAEQHDLPVLGIHRGTLGFLTDIPPDAIEQIGPVLKGEYIEDKRHFFITEFTSDEGTEQQLALNEVALLRGHTTNMIEFDTYANDKLIYAHRADGLIVATPTGSTAYALSGGGSILDPSLNATILVPMFPHTLSSRPIVIAGDAEIRIHIKTTNITQPDLCFDGRYKSTLALDSDVIIKQYDHPLTLIHPLNYCYYHTLREKLGWEHRATRK